jgi:hypothetical protein
MHRRVHNKQVGFETFIIIEYAFINPAAAAMLNVERIL